MKLKKILALLVATIMMLSTMSFAAMAEETDYVAKLAGTDIYFSDLAEAFTDEKNPEHKQVVLLKDYNGDLVINNNCVNVFYLEQHTFTGQIKVELGGLTLYGQNTISQGRGKLVNTGVDGKYPIYLTGDNSNHINISNCDIVATEQDGVALYSDSKSVKINLNQKDTDDNVNITGNVKLEDGFLNIYSGNSVNGNFDVIKGTLNIIGGTYTTDVSEYLPIGKMMNDNGDGTYSVVVDPNSATLDDIATDASGAYLISNANEFVLFRNLIEAGACGSNEFKLAADIDLASYTLSGGSDARFNGTFDGQGYTVKNVTIDAEGKTNVGLINNLGAPGTVKNVTLENVTVYGENFVGGVVGRSRAKSVVENCHIVGTVDIKGSTHVGALMGNTVNSITNCTVDATGSVVGSSSVGGLVGTLTSVTGEISGNSVKGISVKGSAAVGGIAGNMQPGGVEIKNNTVENVAVEGNSSVGLVLGWIFNNGKEMTLSDNSASDSSLSVNGKPGFAIYGEIESDVTDAAKVVALVAGKPFDSLEAAVNAAQDGDVIDLLGNTMEVTKNPKMHTKHLTFQNGTMDFTNATAGNGLFDITANQSIKFKDMTLLIKDREQGSGMCYWMDLRAQTAEAYFENCVIDFDSVQYSYISGNGFGKVYFTDCTISAEQANLVYMAGATFDNCTFDGYADLSEGEAAGNIINHAAVDCVIKNSKVNTRRLGVNTGAISIIDGSFVTADTVGTIGSVNGLITVDASSTLEAANINLDLINEASAGTVISKADKVYVQFREKASDAAEKKVYDIVLVGANAEKINELASADLTFEFVGSPVAGAAKMNCEIAAKEGVMLTKLGNRYMFNYDGINLYEETDNAIAIGTVTVTGYGSFTFKTSDATTNAVYATEIKDNIVDEFKTAAELVINTEMEAQGEPDDGMVGKIESEIKVPTKKLTVNVSFPNAVVDNAVAYQDMKVEITGNIDGVNQTVTYDLGKDGKAMTDGSYKVVEDRVVVNNKYTVTVSGAGYRTATYTVMMTEDKTLNFWNNVMDDAKEVEVDEVNSKAYTTFLAGDIVKDANINIYDLSAVVAYFGEVTDTTQKSDYSKYDLNRDGYVDSKDVAYVLVSWNN